MVTITGEHTITEKPLADASLSLDEDSHAEQIISSSAKDASQHLLVSHKFVSHHPKSGLNPLSDAASYLFSLAGKLKQLKSYRQLSTLQKELMSEINTFQETATAQGYTSEYIVVSRYALCATLDDIIANTLWGAQGQWDSYRLLAAFNQEAAHQDRFFVILERIIKDPALYIDVMEFMYVCLSLGYKGQYRATEFSNNQLEQITNSLYKRIRAHRGDFSKLLSPFPIKPTAPTSPSKKSIKHMPLWLVLTLATVIIASVFVGLGITLDKVANQAYQDLLQIGQTSAHENHNEQ